MNTTALPAIDPRSYIRTYVPLLIGMLLGWLITSYTAVADVLASADELLVAAGASVNARTLLDALAIALVTAAYYWTARQIGRRWPSLERWLLGSSAQPVYGLAQAEIVDADITITDNTNTEGN